MKKIASIFTAIITTLLFSITPSAESEGAYYYSIGDYYALLLDIDNVLTEEEEKSIVNQFVFEANENNMNIGFIITSEISPEATTEDIMNFADILYDQYFPEGSNGTLFLLNNTNYINWLAVSGVFETQISSYDTGSLYYDVGNAIIEDDYAKAANTYREIIADCAKSLADQGLYTTDTAVSDEQQTATNEEDVTTQESEPEQENYSEWGSGMNTEEIDGNIALLHDLDDSLSEAAEQNAMGYIVEAVKETGFSVCVVITDDIGPDKSDREVIDYADVYYEDYCGINTDGILLLINNDTKYDWISTSGNCIDMFYDAIDPIFDDMYDYIVDGNFENAVYYFAKNVIYYSNQDYEHYSDYGDDYDGYSDDWGDYYDDEISIDISGLLGLLFFACVVIAIALLIFAGIIKSSYSLSKNKSASPYQLKNSLTFSQKSDTYIRTYTTRTRVSSSSSGGRSGGGRSHRSSGGGRHGGGGRRR